MLKKNIYIKIYKNWCAYNIVCSAKSQVGCATKILTHGAIVDRVFLNIINYIKDRRTDER